MTYKEMVDLRNKYRKEKGNPFDKYESAMRKVKQDLHEYLLGKVTKDKKDEEALACDPSYVSRSVQRVDGDTRDIIRCVTTSPIKFLLAHKDELKLLDILEPILDSASKDLLKLYHKVNNLTSELNEAKKLASSNSNQPSSIKVDDVKK